MDKSWNLGILESWTFLKNFGHFCKVCKMRHQPLANYRTKQKMPIKFIYMLRYMVTFFHKCLFCVKVCKMCHLASPCIVRHFLDIF